MNRVSRLWPAAVAVAFILGFALALPLGLSLGAGGDLQLISLAPDGRERVEIYGPTRWQRLIGYDRDDAVARIADVANGETLSISPVFYSNDMGSVAWRRDGVDLGMAAHWDRATGRWQLN